MENHKTMSRLPEWQMQTAHCHGSFQNLMKLWHRGTDCKWFMRQIGNTASRCPIHDPRSWPIHTQAIWSLLLTGNPSNNPVGTVGRLFALFSCWSSSGSPSEQGFTDFRCSFWFPSTCRVRSLTHQDWVQFVGITFWTNTVPRFCLTHQWQRCPFQPRNSPTCS